MEFWEFWKGVILGVMAGGAFGVLIMALCIQSASRTKCEECQAEIVKSLKGE